MDKKKVYGVLAKMSKKIKALIKKTGAIRLLSLPLMMFWVLPIKQNRVLLVNFRGKPYGDSPKYIAEELRKHSELDLYWVIEKKKNNSIPESIKQVRLYSLKFFYIMATAKIWVANSRFDSYMHKRKEQYYIQTWHGGLALKKIEFDAEDKLDDYYKGLIKRENKVIDLMVSNSVFCTDMYRRGFRYKGKIIELGTPRNDVLIKGDPSARKRVLKYFGLGDVKIVVYAPTFRNKYDSNPYDIDFERLIGRLKENGYSNLVVLVRLHPMAQQYSDKFFTFNNKIIDATRYPDMQDLILACDYLITDYSSVMFESLIAKKPVILYVKDIDEYADERGYYFDLEKLPFVLAKNNNELDDRLKLLNGEKELKMYEEFKRQIGLKESGKASEYLSEMILKECRIR